MTLTDKLPDELLYTVFAYLNSAQLGRVSRTSYRWCAVGNDPYLLQKHPLVDGQFKGKIIYDMITKDSNDLDYLVGLSTPTLPVSKITWCLYTYTARLASWFSARNAIWETADLAARNAAMTAAVDVATNSAWYAAGVAAESVFFIDGQQCPIADWDTAKSMAWDIVRDAGMAANYLHMWENHQPAIIGKKACQIAECLVLLLDNTKFYRYIQSIAKDLPDCTMSGRHLKNLRGDNPWIRQYELLYSLPLGSSTATLH